MGLRLYLFVTCVIAVYDFRQDFLLVADFDSQNNDTPITASTIDRKQHFSHTPPSLLNLNHVSPRSLDFSKTGVPERNVNEVASKTHEHRQIETNHKLMH